MTIHFKILLANLTKISFNSDERKILLWVIFIRRIIKIK